MIQYQQLEALVGSELAQRWHNWLVAAMRRYGITTHLEHFLAQLLHESGGFRHVVELWGPTEAQKRYQSHPHLGNTEPGDGYRFRGRGLIQLTGRHNYQKAARALGLPLLERPELLELPVNAALAAAWYWTEWGIPQAIQAASPDREAMLQAATRRVNGGLNGLDDRRRWLSRAEAALGTAPPLTPPPPPAPPGEELPPPDRVGTIVFNTPIPRELPEQLARSTVSGAPVVWRGDVLYRVRPATGGGLKLDVRMGGGSMNDQAGKAGVRSTGVMGGLASAVGATALVWLPVFGVEVTPEIRDAVLQTVAAFGLLAAFGRAKADKPITGFFRGGPE